MQLPLYDSLSSPVQQPAGAFPALAAFFRSCSMPPPEQEQLSPGLGGSQLSSAGFRFCLAELAARRPSLDLSSYAHLPRSIDEGFDFGLRDAPVQNTFAAPANKKLTPQEANALDLLYAEEERLGRMSAVMPRADMERFLGSPFHASKANCTPKSSGGFRAYADYSAPRKGDVPSRNSLIDSDLFLCHWPSFTEMLAFFTEAADAPGTLCGSVDAKAYFRQFPIASRDRKHLVIHQKTGQFRANLCLDLGISSAPGVAGNLGDFLVLCLEHFLDVEVLRWVDDLVLKCRSGAVLATAKMDQIEQFMALLGVVLAPEKKSPFARTVTFFGFLWDLDKRSVALTDKKRTKYLLRLRDFLAQPEHNLLALEKVVGVLVHICLLVEAGPAHMTSLFAHARSWDSRNPFPFHHLSRPAAADLQWWLDTIADGPCRLLQKPPPVLDLLVHTDASLKAMGVWIEGAGLCRRFAPHVFERADFNIGSAEALAVELALRVLIDSRSVRDCSLLFHVDNMGVVEGWSNRRSRNLPTNGTFLRVLDLLHLRNLHLKLEYIHTKSNNADAVSREDMSGCVAFLPSPPLPPEVESLLLPK
jgi:hypothetical protein